MFNKKFKLIGTAIGLVAVLMMVLALPGATQQNPLSRQGVVNALDQLFAAFTAAEGDIFDQEAAMFYSDTLMTLAFIPQHPASRSLTLIDDLIAGKAKNVTLERLYVAEDLLDRSERPLIKRGLYTIKAVNANTIAFVDAEDTEVLRAPLRLQKLSKPLPTPITHISAKLVEEDNSDGHKRTVCAWVTVTRCLWFICWSTEVRVCVSIEGMNISVEDTNLTSSPRQAQPWASQVNPTQMAALAAGRLRVMQNKTG